MGSTTDSGGVTRAIAGVGGTLLLTGAAAAQVTSLVSIDPNGQLPNDDAFDAVISPDGRYVAFQWYDGMFTSDLFLSDRETGALERLSVNSNEKKGNSFSYVPTPTPDLRYVAFSSWATNLVTGDTNGPYPLGHDVFVRDRLNGTTERVSIGNLGQQGADQSFHPAITADGRYVAFTSYAANLVAGDLNGVEDVFLRDRLAGTTELVSLDPSGAQANGGIACSSISADGRYVVFHGSASNLVAGDTNASLDVFVRDRLTGTTERVSVDSSGAQGNKDSYGGPISPDGRYAAFSSAASNLVPGDTNGKVDVFLRDRHSGTTERLSVDSSGTQGNGDSTIPALTPDGRFAAFQSDAGNLVAGDTNGSWDVFVRDRQLGTTQLVSVDSNGAPGGTHSGIQGPTLSVDGRYVAFDSDAQLDPEDTNDWHDIYVRDRGCGSGSQSYCTAGTSASGCSAAISSTGTAGATASSGFVVAAAGVEGQRKGLFFFGTNGQQAIPWGNGTSYQCVVPPVVRAGPLPGSGTLGACDGSFAQDLNALWCPTCPKAGANPGAGATVQIQLWYRDPASTSNQTTSLSNALQVEVCP
jgi:Tol biopolymer transport system component